MHKILPLIVIVMAIFILGTCGLKKTLNDVFDYSSIDNLLKEQKYNYSDSDSNKIIMIIKYNLDKFESVEYTVANNETIKLSLNNDEYLIVSLPSNQTITYSWDIINSIDNNIIKFNHKSCIHLSDKDQSYGISYDRDNYYFSVINNGNAYTTFERHSTSYESIDNFKFTIDISTK